MNSTTIRTVSKTAGAARLSRAEAKEATRGRVLEAAEAAFRRDGYHGASLERIASDAGHTIGAVYSTFDSKADVMLTLMATRLERRRARWAEILDAVPTVEGYVAEVSRQIAGETAAERDWFAVVVEFMIVISRDEELLTRYAEIHEASLSALADSIRTWMRRAGELGGISPRRLATTVTALSRGLVVETLVAPTEVSEDLIVEAHMTLLRGSQAGRTGRSGR